VLADQTAAPTSRERSAITTFATISNARRRRMPRGKGQATIKDVMHRYKAGELHSGSKTGPKGKSRKQAIAIAISESKPKKGK
jgi:Family of unknown function (DUF6496)